MLPVFADYIERLSDLHQDFAQAIGGLSVTALDWVAGAEMNSLCVLVVHTTGATRFWVGDVAMGEPSNRVRASEFQAKGYDETRLRQRLDETFGYVEGALARLSLDDLAVVRLVPGRDQQYRVGWALFHALEHVGLHLGHAQMTRQLWNQGQAERA